MRVVEEDTEHRDRIIPLWGWGIAIVIVLLTVFLAFSIALDNNYRQKNRIVRAEPLPAEQPAPTQLPPPTAVPPPVTTPTEPGITTPPSITETPTPSPAPTTPQAPQGVPQTLSFDGQDWEFAGGPMQINVVTTGQFTGGRVIYHRVGDQPPYDALYIETAPNSDRFYRYTPGTSETAE